MARAKYAFLFICLCLLLSASVQAQPIKWNYTGKLLDSVNKEPVAFAELVVYTKTSKQILFQTNTDLEGVFTIQLPAAGVYQLAITAMGYKTRLLDLETSTKVLPTLYLVPDIKQLDEVEITGQRIAVQAGQGKVTYDASSTAANLSGTALELTSRLPGVSIDNSGEIFVRGRKGTRIWVDGRPAPLADTDPKAFLQSIPASSIAKVEVIHQPDASYDAGGGAAIIHIYLKKSASRGQNFRGSGTVGTPLNKFNGSALCNIYIGKRLLYIEATARSESFAQRWQEQRNMRLSDSSLQFKTFSTGNDLTRQMQLRGGWEEELGGAKVGLTGQLSYNLDYAPWQQRNDFTRNNLPTNAYTLANSLYRTQNQVLNTGAFYHLSLNHQKLRWLNDIAYTKVLLKTRDKLQTSVFDENGFLIEQLTPLLKPSRKLNNFTVNSQFRHTVHDHFKLQYGLKNESNINDNTFELFYIENNQEIRDEEAYNKLNYNENIAAAFFSGDMLYNIFQITAGLRAEHTHVWSNQAEVRQNYISLFPNLRIQMPIDSSMELSLAYNRRIERPTFNQLNNASSMYDIYTLNSGNPNLRPQFVQNIAIEYSALLLGAPVFASLTYAATRNAFEELSKVEENSRIRMQPFNWGNANFYGLDAGINVDINSTIKVSFSGGVYYNEFNTKVEGLRPFRSGWVAQGNLTVSADLGKNWQTQLLNNYDSGFPFFNGTSSYSGNTDFVLKRSWLNGRWQVFGNVNDVFNTNRWWGQWQGVNTEGSGRWKPESRIFYLGVIWQWNKGEKEVSKTELEQNNRLKLKGSGR
jgi:hypothetical protein